MADNRCYPRARVSLIHANLVSRNFYEAVLSPFSGRVVQDVKSFMPLSGSVGDGSGVSVSQPVPQEGILITRDTADR